MLLRFSGEAVKDCLVGQGYPTKLRDECECQDSVVIQSMSHVRSNAAYRYHRLCTPSICSNEIETSDNGRTSQPQTKDMKRRGDIQRKAQESTKAS